MTEELGTSLVQVIADRDTTGLFLEASERALDQALEGVLDEELLSEIPLIRTLRALYRCGIGIRQFLFIRKIVRFLRELHSISEEDREAFASQLNADPEFRERVGESLILLLDQMDDLKKPELLGRAFRAYVRGEISFEVFRRMGIAIERCFLPDFDLLPQVGTIDDLPAPAASSFYTSGLTELAAVVPTGGPGALNKFQLSEFGKTFIKIVFETEPQV
jgi:hypothetical protein